MTYFHFGCFVNHIPDYSMANLDKKKDDFLSNFVSNFTKIDINHIFGKMFSIRKLLLSSFHTTFDQFPILLC